MIDICIHITQNTHTTHECKPWWVPFVLFMCSRLTTWDWLIYQRVYPWRIHQSLNVCLFSFKGGTFFLVLFLFHVLLKGVPFLIKICLLSSILLWYTLVILVLVPNVIDFNISSYCRSKYKAKGFDVLKLLQVSLCCVHLFFFFTMVYTLIIAGADLCLSSCFQFVWTYNWKM